jgi:biopolymer transport protein ExbB/TolQ
MAKVPHDAAHTAFFRWLILIGILLFGAYVAQRHALPSQLLESDESRLSLVILGVFLISSLDAGRRAWQLGTELQSAFAIRHDIAAGAQLFERDDRGLLRFSGNDSTDSFTHQHLLLLANKTVQHGALCPQDTLLERLENAIGRGHETGWFIADLMVRLGLLGTVIGFIYMLGSISQVSGVDMQALKQLLGNMSGGMRIALYTTLTGLGAGILLGLQYRLLDQAVDRLMAEIIELSEVDVVTELRRLLTPAV